MTIKNSKLLIASIVLSQTAGIVGSLFTTSKIPTWYAGLTKPWFNPPSWLFGPVWITLYTLMGISLYLVWVKGYQKDKIKMLVNLFIVHLAINALWSIVFFGLENLGGALLVIGLLWLMIACLIKNFYSINRRAALLLIPYLLWVSFATILNFAIWRLN